MMCYRSPHKRYFNSILSSRFFFFLSLSPSSRRATPNAMLRRALLILYPGAVCSTMPNHKFSRDGADDDDVDSCRWNRYNKTKGGGEKKDRRATARTRRRVFCPAPFYFRDSITSRHFSLILFPLVYITIVALLGKNSADRIYGRNNRFRILCIRN